MRPILNASSKTARPLKPEPIPTAAPNTAPGRSRLNHPASLKPLPPNPQKPNWLSPTKDPPTHSRKSMIFSITFPPNMCGADSSAPQVHLFPPHKGCSPAGCPVDRYFVCGLIEQHVPRGRRNVKPCDSSVQFGRSALQEA